MQKNWWEKFISLESSESVDIKRKQLVLNACSYLGGTIILYFGLQTSSEQQLLLRMSLLFSALLLYINVIILYWHKSMQLALVIYGIVVFPLILALVYTGGYQNTGLYWIFPFPITIFVFYGYLRGLLINIAIFSIITFMLINHQYIAAEYRNQEISRFLASYVVCILFCLINEYFRYRSHQELAEINFDKQRQANSDALTDLPNRRFINSVFFQASKQDPVAYFPMMLVVIDVDHFKKVNDAYGHDTGDSVLKHIAGVLKAHTRESDVVARTGGEEFLIAFPKTDVDLGLNVSEKLHNTMSNTPYVDQTSGLAIDVTVSMGCVCVEEYYDIELALKKADDLLYQAKRNGRNRIEHIL